MRIRRLLAAAVLLIPTASLADPPAVAVRVVKYDGLTGLIKQHRGKVVVVDFWADYCIPCKREFSKLVALHQKTAKDGLVAISVSLDDPAGDGVKDKVLAFLQKQQAAMTNLILDEKPEVWQAKLKIDGPPLVVVFNREGGIEQRFHDKEVDYAVIEKLTAELLAK